MSRPAVPIVAPTITTLSSTTAWKIIALPIILGSFVSRKLPYGTTSNIIEQRHHGFSAVLSYLIFPLEEGIWSRHWNTCEGLAIAKYDRQPLHGVRERARSAFDLLIRLTSELNI